MAIVTLATVVMNLILIMWQGLAQARLYLKRISSLQVLKSHVLDITKAKVREPFEENNKNQEILI